MIKIKKRYFLILSAASVTLLFSDINDDLLKAVYENNYKTVKSLIEKGADINIREYESAISWNSDDTGFTPLMIASEKGYEKIVKLLIVNGANINDESVLGYTALMIAVYYNHKEVVKILLKNRADVNITSYMYETALTMAILYTKNSEIIKLLVNAGANINISEYISTYQGVPLFIRAVADNDINTDIIELLIRNGADINIKDTNVNDTALIRASIRGFYDKVKLLIDTGAEIDACDDGGGTALYWASRYGYRDIINILIKSKADINDGLAGAARSGDKDLVDFFISKNADINYGLVQASAGGHNELVDFFISKGADINFIDMGDSPLSMAAFFNKLDTVKILLANGAVVNDSIIKKEINFTKDKNIIKLLISNDKKNGIYWAGYFGDKESINDFILKGADIDKSLSGAVKGGKNEIVKYLIKKGANADGKDPFNNELNIITASIYGYYEIVKLLTETNADINVCNMFNETALTYAALNGNLKILSILIKTGINDINQMTNAGDTALIIASREGHLDAVKFLIKSGAKINLRNNYGYTALSTAIKYNHEDIVNFLRDKGALE